MHPNNKLTVNAIEAASLEDFSTEVWTRRPYARANIHFSHIPSHPRLSVRTFKRPKRYLAAMVQRRTRPRLASKWMYMKRCSMHWSQNDVLGHNPQLYPLRKSRVQPLRLPQVSPEKDKIESSYTRLRTESLRSEGNQC